MGAKGDKATNAGAEAAARFVDELSAFFEVTSKKMFGGHGISHEGVMFVIVDSAGDVFFRTDDASVGPYEAAGSDKHGRMPYHQVPEAVRVNPSELQRWATTALETARRNKKK